MVEPNAEYSSFLNLDLALVQTGFELLDALVRRMGSSLLEGNYDVGLIAERSIGEGAITYTRRLSQLPQGPD